ncbi:MAG: MauE/DoxX family redox-associated membrane protein [Calditrichota bacterium]
MTPLNSHFSSHKLITSSGLEKISRWSRRGLGLIFVVAAISKGLDPIRFARQCEQILLALGCSYGSATYFLSGAVASGIILSELTIGAWLICGVYLQFAIWAGIVGLLGFLGLSIWNLSSQAFSECGCFGGFYAHTGIAAAVENISFLVVAWIGQIKIRLTHRRKDYYLSNAIIAAILTVFALLYIFPPKGNALRPGASSLRLIEVLGRVDLTDCWVWFLDPECVKCQNLTDEFSLSADSTKAILVAVTAASPGRMAEFQWDFAPQFPLIRISEKEWRRFGVPAGSLVIAEGNRIQKIVRDWEVKGFIAKYFNPPIENVSAESR